MSTLPSIRQNRRLTAGGLWQTLSDVRPTILHGAEKAQETSLFGRIASVCQLYEDPNLGAKLDSGTTRPLCANVLRRRGRRRAMARTYVILAFGLGLGACSQAEYRDAQSHVAPMSVKNGASSGKTMTASFVPCTETPAGDPGHDRVWAACMTMHKPNGRHPPAEMLFTDWRGR